MLQRFNNCGILKPVPAVLILIITIVTGNGLDAQVLRAGTGKSNITGSSGIVNDSLYAKALILDNGKTKLVILTLDVLAVGRTKPLDEEFVINVRNRIQKEFGINTGNILINASHNHCSGPIPGDVADRTVLAVRRALMNMELVKTGMGTGFENRISMNRRVKLRDGKVFTIRQANPNMPDEMITGVGETDNEIGILRIDRLNGSTKALIYNYACHPYTGVPNGGITAELPGFASKVIEDQLGNNAMAFFLQGAAGDITEILYKDVNDLRDCEPFGQMLGLSTLNALKSIPTAKTERLSIITETVQFPLRTDIPDALKSLDEEEQELLGSLRSTSLNIKTFIPLYIKYSLSPDYPSYYSYRYLQEEKNHSNNLERLDELNRKNMNKYMQNIHAMEKLSQIQEDKAMLKFSRDEIKKYGGSIVPAEIQGIRIGDFIIVTFPAEVCVKVGLHIKELSPCKNTFIAAYSNGYINYAPASEDYKDWGYEFTRAILKPEWQKMYEEKIIQIIKQL